MYCHAIQSLEYYKNFHRFEYEVTPAKKTTKRKSKKKGVAETDIDPEMLDLSETNRSVIKCDPGCASVAQSNTRTVSRPQADMLTNITQLTQAF